MSEANDVQRTNDGEAATVRATMGIGEAAAALGLTTAQVRRLCKLHERNPDEGLAFAWSRAWAVTHDINGHALRGHRMPYADAVQDLAEAKRKAEQEYPG